MRGSLWNVCVGVLVCALLASRALAAGGGSYVVQVGAATQYIEPLQDLPSSGSPLGWTARVYDTTQDNGKGDTGNGDGTGNWQTGKLGVGYGDGDDLTQIKNDGNVSRFFFFENIQ